MSERELDVDLPALVRELRAAERQAATWHDEIARIVADERPETERYAELKELFRKSNDRAIAARAALAIVQRSLDILLGPPPPMQRDDVSALLDQARKADAEVEAASGSFGSAIDTLLSADRPTPQLWAQFHDAAERQQRATNERRRISSELLRRLSEKP